MNNKQYLYVKEKQRLFIAFDQSNSVKKEIIDTYRDTYVEDENIEREILKLYKRVISSKSFNENMILALFIPFKYLKEKIDDQFIVDYLWEEKNLISFIIIESEEKKLAGKIDFIKKQNAFGISVRANIPGADIDKIRKKVSDLFEIALQAYKHKLIPILEFIVEMNSGTKLEAEALLKEEILLAMEGLEIPIEFILRLSLPTRHNAYEELINNPKILRIIGSSGGLSKEQTIQLINKNPKMDSSFGQLIFRDLKYEMDEEEFDSQIYNNIQELFLETKEIKEII